MHENESEYEVFMKLFSVLRIASKEIMQQTFPLDFIYGRKHFCHPASSRKLQNYASVILSNNGTIVNFVNSGNTEEL